MKVKPAGEATRFVLLETMSVIGTLIPELVAPADVAVMLPL